MGKFYKNVMFFLFCFECYVLERVTSFLHRDRQVSGWFYVLKNVCNFHLVDFWHLWVPYRGTTTTTTKQKNKKSSHPKTNKQKTTKNNKNKTKTKTDSTNRRNTLFLVRNNNNNKQSENRPKIDFRKNSATATIFGWPSRFDSPPPRSRISFVCSAQLFIFRCSKSCRRAHTPISVWNKC